MTIPASDKAAVLSQLREYETLAMRLALRRQQEGGWMLHTLVLDAIPEPYARDSAAFAERYTLVRDVLVYPSAVFIMGIRESAEIISWFDSSREFSIPAPKGPGTSTRVFTTHMPEFQNQPLMQHYYYRTTQYDGFDRMHWPHTVYTFPRLQRIPEPDDTSILIGTAETGSRTFPNFKMALRELIYGQTDWETAQNWSVEPQVAIRIVREQPFFASIKQVDPRRVTTTIHGLPIPSTVVQLTASGGLSQEHRVLRPETYMFTLERDLPRLGQLTLVQDSDVLDKCEWDSQYTPLPGAPKTASGIPTIRDLPQTTWYPGISGNFESNVHVSPALPQPETQNDPHHVPLSIRDTLVRFRNDHPDSAKTGFIMMRFGKTPVHNAIAQTIKKTLAAHGLEAVRADDKQYHSELYDNVLTYMHGCGFGIAVFERLETDEFNPNVALEVGYMLALGKPVCLLKGKTLHALHADLIGKLYKEFDQLAQAKTIPKELNTWLHDHDLT